MSKLLTSLLAVATAFAGVSALPSEIGQLESRASSTNYSLFAYGSGDSTEIGGFPIFYFNGS